MTENRMKSKKSIKMDDSKIIGRMTEKRHEKIKTSNQFQTHKFRTEMSNWTPVVHKPSNEQIYKERRELIGNWFQLWSDSQRRRFLHVIFMQCRQAQLRFVQDWFQTKVPLKKVDFTRVLPRFLSLYILSFLDPRSLSRASSVCWLWNFLAEQDVLWMRKCTQLGWYLPYTPSSNEYGAWKKHYVVCMFNLLTAPPKSEAKVTADLTHKLKTTKQDNKKSRSLTLAQSQEMLNHRPPWLPPDSYPQDLEQGWRCLQQSFNPNVNNPPDCQLLFHNKFGILKSLLLGQSVRQKSDGLVGVGLTSAQRMHSHHLYQEVDSSDNEMKKLLSHSLELESYSEKRLLELVKQPWEPASPSKVLCPRRVDLSGGGEYPLPWSTMSNVNHQGCRLSIDHPHVIFVSSRVPAAEILVDAVLFGVITIVYEYEGTTLESLLSRLDTCLQGRNAQSVGIFTHNTVPWQINLLQGSTVTLQNLNDAHCVEFFTSIANHVQSSADQGHVDILVPLASCESGTEILTQLSILTGIPFDSPSGIVGNHILGPWSVPLQTKIPTELYFCSSKLQVWSNIADQVNEACQKTKAMIARYFEQNQVDLVSQLVGQVILDMTCDLNLPQLDHIRRVLNDALLQLQSQHNVDPLQFLGQFISSKAKSHQTKFQTMTPEVCHQLTDTLTGHLQLDERYESSEQSDVTAEERKLNKEMDEDKDHDSAAEDSISEEIISGDNKQVEEKLMIPEIKHSQSSPTASKCLVRRPSSVENTSVWADTSSTMLRTKDCVNQTSQQRACTDEPRRPPESDRRSQIACEILSSELKYKNKLDIVRTVFYKPLKSALDSNRAILSLQNINIIFTDILMLLELSQDLLLDLQARMKNWQLESCLGDVFVKLSGWLKVYVNYFNNYPVILRNIERCMEQTAAFRAFLKRHQGTCDTNMKTLAQLLLSPSRRICEYVRLLSAFRASTPPDHADQSDLKAAITALHEVNSMVEQFKLRGERERELMRLQKVIVACPALLEANRYFLRQLDMSHLKTSTHHIDTECRTYHHIDTLGLFLFNDSLVITRRTCRHIPFECCVEFTYRFHCCVSLRRLRLKDIPDSKYVQNAMKLYTPNRQWICCSESRQQKQEWIALIENTIQTQLSTHS